MNKNEIFNAMNQFETRTLMDGKPSNLNNFNETNFWNMFNQIQEAEMKQLEKDTYINMLFDHLYTWRVEKPGIEFQFDEAKIRTIINAMKTTSEIIAVLNSFFYVKKFTEEFILEFKQYFIQIKRICQPIHPKASKKYDKEMKIFWKNWESKIKTKVLNDPNDLNSLKDMELEDDVYV